MPKIYINAQAMVNGLGLTGADNFPQLAQADEDNNINFVIPTPEGWDGDPMSLRIYGGASEQPNTDAKCTVRSGMGATQTNIAYGNPSDCDISLDVNDGFPVLGSATVAPIGSGELLRVNIEYLSETYGGKLQVAGAELTFAVV